MLSSFFFGLIMVASIKNNVSANNVSDAAAAAIVTFPLTLNEDGYMLKLIVEGQTFNLLLDSGSSDTWIRGPYCTSNDTSCTPYQAQSLLPATLSSSLVEPLSNFTFTYGVGMAAGQIIHADLQVPYVKSDKYHAGLPCKASTEFLTSHLAIGSTLLEHSNAGIDGIIGLSFTNYSPIALSSSLNSDFMKGMNVDLFSMFLADNNETQLINSSLTVGGWDEANKETGEIPWFPMIFMSAEVAKLYKKITPVSWWIFNLGESYVTIGEWEDSYKLPSLHPNVTKQDQPQKIPLSSGNTTQSFVDCGYGSLLLSKSASDAINNALGGEYNLTGDSWNLPCWMNVSGPSLTFHMIVDEEAQGVSKLVELIEVEEGDLQEELEDEVGGEEEEDGRGRTRSYHRARHLHSHPGHSSKNVKKSKCVKNGKQPPKKKTVTINVQPQNYVYSSDGGKTCVSLIEGIEGEGYGILGIPFLQGSYTVYKKSWPPALGFSQARHYFSHSFL